MQQVYPSLISKAKLIILIFIFGLSGCSQKFSKYGTSPLPSKTQKKPEPSKSNVTIKRSQTPAIVPRPSPAKDQGTENKEKLCVFRAVKGIAEVQDFEANLVRLKFYPGDDIFELPISKLDPLSIYKGMEIKMIKQEPVSGPCGQKQFEVKPLPTQ